VILGGTAGLLLAIWAIDLLRMIGAQTVRGFARSTSI